MPPIQYRTQVMDHLGLVAGMCKSWELPTISTDGHLKYLTNGTFLTVKPLLP